MRGCGTRGQIDADRREATHRGAACCDGPKCSVRLRHVTLLGWPMVLDQYIPIKQVFEAGHIHFQNNVYNIQAQGPFTQLSR